MQLAPCISWCKYILILRSWARLVVGPWLKFSLWSVSSGIGNILHAKVILYTRGSVEGAHSKLGIYVLIISILKNPYNTHSTPQESRALPKVEIQ